MQRQSSISAADRREKAGGSCDGSMYARDARTAIPVSVGIAAAETLAKVANHRAKKDPTRQGVCVILDDAATDKGNHYGFYRRDG
jgi:hypothetical protein